MASYFWQKVGMLVAILVSSVVCGFLPLALKNVRPALKKKLLSYGNCFAGGVFFSIGFVHLLSESSDLMHDIIQPTFPLSFILSISGFMAVFFVEKVLLSSHHSTTYANLESTAETKTGSSRDNYGSLEEDNHHNLAQMGTFAYILTFVLSIHSLISGVALGMDRNLSTLLSLFVAIISHKWIEAFALGVAINKAQSEDLIPRTFKLILIYSIMEPLGVIIGLILSSHLPDRDLLITQAFVLGLASGTFIYVAVVDIIPAEFSNGNDTDKYYKFGLLAFGVLVIICVVILFTHAHDADG